jgi:uncharacterized membrane protein
MATDPLHALARTLLGKAHHSLDPEEAKVLRGIEARMPIAQDAADLADERATFGERLSDRVAAVGGSWGFIIVFAVVLFGWMLLNSRVLSHWGLAFDPYPFIFLNLVLSTVAAVQAPVIMMSQNRQAGKDRLAASLDYEVNLRAELEILRIHEKLDLAITERLDRIIRALDAHHED